jgi:hypothetical protein
VSMDGERENEGVRSSTFRILDCGMRIEKMTIQRPITEDSSQNQ